MKSKKFITFLLVFIMCFIFISFSNTTKTETNSEDIVFVQTCVVDGVEWKLTMLYDNDVYL